jgi:hypothetical protein
VRGSRLVPFAILGIALAFAAPAAMLAADDQIRLGLTPVGQPGPYFDLVMKPGDTRTLEVDILDAGDAPLAARTYAADVYTIVNGGFGGRLRGEARTGMTRWLDYPTDVLDLRPGDAVRRSFTVAVPANATPGEYIAGLVLENDLPITGAGPVILDQIVRQAVAVVVTVPGRRAPALAIGSATYTLAAQGPIVSVAVENTGNVRLKPVVTFALSDAAGVVVDRRSVSMDTFYAHTATFIEVPLAMALAPGGYTVRLSLSDVGEGVQAGDAGIALVVAEPPAIAPVDDGGPDVTQVLAALGDGSLAPLVIGSLVLGSLLLATAIGVVVVRRRRRTEDGLGSGNAP